MALLGVLVATLALLEPGSPVAAVEQNVASDSFYEVDPESGTLSVSVEATIQNAGGSPASVFYLWAMPGAQNILVQRDGQNLPAEVFAEGGPDGVTLVTVSLPSALRPNGTTSLVMTYGVPAQSGEWVRLERGVIETRFVGQGPGSFVYLDVPTSAENYFDPGCLKAADQPKDVTGAGRERWICGETTLIAINAEDQALLKRCAAADDRCRQRALVSPFNGYVQSISDPSTQGVHQGQVMMGDRPVNLVLHYFIRDGAWAEEQFATATAAAPLLRDLFGFDIEHSTLTMRQSRHILLLGAGGLAFTTQGEVLLTIGTGYDREITVHELAHQWAGHNIAEPWMWEGLAEYATRVLAPQLGYPTVNRPWQSFGVNDPLVLWHNGSSVTNPDYWYGKSGAFFFAFEQAIGGRENMRAVLAMMDDNPERLPLDGRWLIDAGERVSGANLDSLFLGWVFNPSSASGALQERRAAHDTVKGLTSRAATLGLSGLPSDIQANLDAWTFGAITGQVERAGTVLDSYESMLALAASLELPATGAVQQAWSTKPITGAASAVEYQRQVLLAIQDAKERMAQEPEGSPALPKFAAAVEAYTAGNFDEAQSLAGAALAAAEDKITAVRVLEKARLAQVNYHGGMLGRIGLLFMDPAGDLDRADAKLQAGEPTEALNLANSALDAWEGASTRGIKRLTIASGVLFFVFLVLWWVLQRADNQRRSTGPGHALGEKPTASWRDWGNIP
ncbi:MAG TPA: hypothetical protein VIH05_01725 [Tepidiformaceae bacterium]